MNMENIVSRARRKVLVFDGAMGTEIQARNLSAEDFSGASTEGCNEVLVITRPHVIAEIHAAYLAAGADVIETNSFGSSAIVLGEFGWGDRAYELSRRAVEVACSVARSFS